MTIQLKSVDSPGFQRQPVRTQILAKAGFAAPDEHAELASRLAAFKNLDKPVSARLVDALIAGDDDDALASLRAQAIAEHGSVERLNGFVEKAVAHRLASIVRADAAATYEAVQERFNTAAAALTVAAGLVDPTTSAHDILALNDLKVQKAWQAAATHSAELDALLVPLVGAAMNAGVAHPAASDSVAGSRSPKSKSLAFGLTVDASGCEDYRAPWNAWDSDNNAWAALLAAGATIHAKDLDAYEPARIPSRLVDVKTLRADGTYVYITTDPDLEAVEG
ncbi:hypothetical protein M1247_29580 [Mycobacterium sp. 21AC1]|uniref:hypothetical protein n=1 Tax=[Mycobacterium] appelbergii TaxID=2939269 RepID=UPI002938D83C|nr:hypothetical protein [Mycobacterium sp. 21AC1]MDV3129089.1 hypothetical protein [Mycobacterium sp. 21AC1]